MTAIEITIGWTRSEVVDGSLVYSSFGDGYKPGASQHTETITVDVDTSPADTDLSLIGEAVFRATNDPSAGATKIPLVDAIHDAIAATGYRGQGAHYSLSVGDTITVGEVMLACDSTGWRRVEGVIA